jgi:hypothetical protein
MAPIVADLAWRALVVEWLVVGFVVGVLALVRQKATSPLTARQPQR